MSKRQTGKFEYWLTIHGEYRWRLKSPNGRTICQSEGYKGKEGCLNGIRAVSVVAGPAKVVNLDA